MKRLRSINSGTQVGIFSPGTACNPSRFTTALEQLSALGFTPTFTFNPSDNYGRYPHSFFCGSKSDRLNSVNSPLAVEEVSWLLAARGGYGSLELLAELDYAQFSARKIPVVGYSDVTAILVAIEKITGLPTIHGPTLSKEFSEYATSDGAKRSVDYLLQLLSGSPVETSFPCSPLRAGKARGKILAGNLTVLCSLLGTPWEPLFDHKILVLEEVDEAPYRVHRSLMQLKVGDKLNKLAGVVFGRFTNCKAKQGPTIEEVLTESIQTFFPAVPVLTRLPFGHSAGEQSEFNLSLPLGCEAEINDNIFSIVESPF